MTNIKVSFFFIVTFFSCLLPAQSVEPYISSLPKGSDLSILVQTVEGKPKTLAKYKSDQFKQPASTQKVITALAAQLELGDNFRFITGMYTNGSLNNKQLSGDLIIKLSGDPTFNRARLKNMITALRQKGVEKISGNVILDTSIFASHDKAEGWSWNNLTLVTMHPHRQQQLMITAFMQPLPQVKLVLKLRFQYHPVYRLWYQVMSEQLLPIVKI